jgi:VanZ family protein
MFERFCRFAFWAALIFAFVMAVLPKPPQLPGAPTDKIQHILAFVALTILATAGYPRLRPLMLVFALAGFGALIEIVQAIPALHRSSDVMDWLADIAAALITLGIVIVLRRLRFASGGKKARSWRAGHSARYFRGRRQRTSSPPESKASAGARAARHPSLRP